MPIPSAEHLARIRQSSTCESDVDDSSASDLSNGYGVRVVSLKLKCTKFFTFGGVVAVIERLHFSGCRGFRGCGLSPVCL